MGQAREEKLLRYPGNTVLVNTAFGKPFLIHCLIDAILQGRYLCLSGMPQILLHQQPANFIMPTGKLYYAIFLNIFLIFRYSGSIHKKFSSDSRFRS